MFKDVNIDDLAKIIGAKEIELYYLRLAVSDLKAQLTDKANDG